MERTGEASDRAHRSGSGIASHYAPEAEAYRDLWAPVLVPLAQWLIDELPLRGARRVLDLGCGVGTLLPHLRQASSEPLVVGLDRTEAMVSLGPREFPLLVGDAVHLPFVDGSFDAVVMAFMLFHLPKPAAGLAEVRRVLRAGGWIGLLTWGDERESRAWARWVEELDAFQAAQSSSKLSWHELVNVPQKMTRQLRGAGFTEVTSRVEVSVDRPTCGQFVARRTRLGQCRHRWESLEEETRQALLGRAFRWLEGMSPEDFEGESEVIITVGRRPE